MRRRYLSQGILRGVTPSSTPLGAGFSLAPERLEKAALSYEVNCSACHGLKGEGISGMVPAFAGNRAMQNDPTNMIHAMLRGARAPHTEERQTAAGMPAFDWKMDDAQIAEVLNYVRNSWGNQASEVTPQQVAEMRQQTGAGNKLKTPSMQ